MLDKMSAHCAALSVASGDKKYIDGACVLTDSDGDKIFSTSSTAKQKEQHHYNQDCFHAPSLPRTRSVSGLRFVSGSL
jgi:hypothetical protein